MHLLIFVSFSIFSALTMLLVWFCLLISTDAGNGPPNLSVSRLYISVERVVRLGWGRPLRYTGVHMGEVVKICFKNTS